MSEDTGPNTTRSFGKKLRTGLVIDLGLLVALEIGLRIFGVTFESHPVSFHFMNNFDAEARQSESIVRPHPRLFWELRPGSRDALARDVINESGFRGPRCSLERTPGTFRLAVLGDSCTYGVSVSWSQTYGAQLREFLSRAHPETKFELINRGVHGYTIYQGSQLLKERVIPEKPDVAVLYYGAWNDFNVAVGVADTEKTGALERSRGVGIGSVVRPLRLLRSYQGLERFAQKFVLEPGRRKLMDSWLHGEYEGEFRVPAPDFERILVEMLESCEKEGIRVVLVVPEINYRYQSGRPNLFEWLNIYREVVLRIGTERGLPLVDLRAISEGIPPDDIFFHRDIVHPNAGGYLHLAYHLYRCIEDQNWVATNREPGKATRIEAPALQCSSMVVSRSKPERITFSVDLGSSSAGAQFVLISSESPCFLNMDNRDDPFPLRIDTDLARSASHVRQIEKMGLSVVLDEKGRGVLSVDFSPDLLVSKRVRFLGFAGFVLEPSELKNVMRSLVQGKEVPTNPVWLKVID